MTSDVDHCHIPADYLHSFRVESLSLHWEMFQNSKQSRKQELLTHGTGTVVHDTLWSDDDHHTVVGWDGSGLLDTLTRGTLTQAPLTPPHPPRVAGHDSMGCVSAPASTWSVDVSGVKLREAELMQYLRPVGLGPSSNTWPRWLPHSLHDTSVLIRLGSAMILNRFPPTETYKVPYWLCLHWNRIIAVFSTVFARKWMSRLKFLNLISLNVASRHIWLDIKGETHLHWHLSCSSHSLYW